MDASALISAWESALTQPPATRTATILSAAGDESPSSLDLGRRERNALQLHAVIAGDTLEGEVACVHCGEHLDVGIPLAALDITPSDDHRVEHDEWHVTLRVPDTQDVCLALDDADSEAALFRACVVTARQAGQSQSADDLPVAVRERCEQRLDELAPLANFAVSWRCPVCGAADSLPLDVGAYVFERVGHWVEDQLEDVARLCRAYNWEEGHVLAMSAWRRRFYLARAGAE